MLKGTYWARRPLALWHALAHDGSRVSPMTAVESSGWVGVRCVFRSTIEGNQVYEERVTLWRAGDLDKAIARAEAEALEYADAVDAEYTGLARRISSPIPWATGLRCSA